MSPLIPHDVLPGEAVMPMYRRENAGFSPRHKDLLGATASTPWLHVQQTPASRTFCEVCQADAFQLSLLSLWGAASPQCRPDCHLVSLLQSFPCHPRGPLLYCPHPLWLIPDFSLHFIQGEPGSCL